MNFKVGDPFIFQSGNLTLRGVVVDPSPIYWDDSKITKNEPRMKVKYEHSDSIGEPIIKYCRPLTKLERILK